MTTSNRLVSQPIDEKSTSQATTSLNHAIYKNMNVNQQRSLSIRTNKQLRSQNEGKIGTWFWGQKQHTRHKVEKDWIWEMWYRNGCKSNKKEKIWKKQYKYCAQNVNKQQCRFTFTSLPGSWSFATFIIESRLGVPPKHQMALDWIAPYCTKILQIQNYAIFYRLHRMQNIA